MEFLPGDIILLKREKRAGLKFIWTLLKQIITFFFEKIGLIEAVDKYYHIEMAFNSNSVITMEPPRCRTLPISTCKMKVFRLKNPMINSDNFNKIFYDYCKQKMGERFDYWKFWAMIFDRILGTRWFTKHFVNPSKDVCNEFVSRFYKELIGVPISAEDPESGLPSDTNDYCSNHPDLFEILMDT